MPRMNAAIVIAATLVACTSSSTTTESDFIEREVPKLRAALASQKISDVLVSCAMTTGGVTKVPATVAAEIERLCYVDAPRLYLAQSVADTRRSMAAHPGMDEISCVQLFAADAFKIVAQHPTKDPELTRLVDEYTRLCPKQVAGFGAR